MPTGRPVSAGGISNVVEDTTPQLGGPLHVNGQSIVFGDGEEARLGDGLDYTVEFDGTNAVHTLLAGSFVFGGGAMLLGGVTALGQPTIEIGPRTGSASPLVVREAGSAGGMSLTAASGYSGFGLGAYFDGSNWRALTAGATLTYKSPTESVTYANAGLTPGNTFAPTIVERMTLANGARQYGANAPARPLELVRNSTSTVFTASGIPSFRVLNSSVATSSFAAIEVQSANGACQYITMSDGIGIGLLGEVGCYCGTQTNHPYWFITNNVKRAGFLADGTFSIPVDSQSILLGAGGDASLLYDGTNLVIDAQAVGAGHIVLNSVKTTTGDPPGAEGLLYWNTVDNVIKMYVDGGWRTLASW